MTALVLLARLLLALVFVVSAVAKLRDRSGSRDAVEAFGVPAALVGPVAATLPLVELLCAALLVTADPGATAGAIGSLLLLAAFTVAIVFNLLQGRRPDCHCFGQIGGGQVSWRSVARNVALMALAGLSLVGAGSLGSVPAVIADYSAGEITAGLLFALLAAAVVGLALALRTLMGRYGTVLMRLEALEIATGTAPPRPAPAFELPDLDGRLASLQDALLQRRPVLVVFLSPTCTLCSELVPLLAEWQGDRDHGVSVVVLSTGTLEDNREKVAGTSLSVLLQPEGEVAAAYGIQGTPAAYLVSEDGLIAAPVAHGVDAVVGLHAAALRTLDGAHGHDGPQLHQIEQRPVSPGDVLPALQVHVDGGELASLQALVAEPAILLFWRTDCGFCAGILDDVIALQDRTRLLIVSSTPTDVLRGSGLTAPVLDEPDGALSQALRVPGTPAAVRIVGGVVDSGLAVGGPEVLALLGVPVAVQSLSVI